MKRIHAVLLPVLVLAGITSVNSSSAQTSVVATPSSPSGFSVIDRGADYKVLQKTTVENGTNRVHSYTEVSTGMHFWNNGQWTESKEQITILPQGGAIANQGRHTVSFPSDIGSGVIKVVTPSGQVLQSRPLGVTYDDSKNSVFIGVLTNSAGWLTASNQVTYKNCFTGIHADLVCTYRRGGFECDLVFREQPPTPDVYGLSGADTTLQLITEFFNTPDPQQVPSAYDDWFGLQDDALKFGKMTMGQGKAFAAKTPNSQLPTAASQTPVYKSWLHLGGRTFLIEQVPLVYLAEELDALPLTSAVQSPQSRVGSLASAISSLPVVAQTAAQAKQILVASAGLNKQPGVVLDYNVLDSDQDDFTFQSGQTYYISGNVNLTGNITIQGGAVLKFPEDGSAGITLATNAIVCPADPAQPAVLTSVNDDSVGDSISGVSSGTPNSGSSLYLYFNNSSDYGDAYGTNSGSSLTVSNLTFSYAGEGLAFYDFITVIWNCQFLNCGTAIGAADDSYFCCDNPVDVLQLNNVLFAGCYWCAVDFSSEWSGLPFVAEQVTADVQCFWNCNGASSLFITNSILLDGGSYWDVYCLPGNVFPQNTVIYPALSDWQGSSWNMAGERAALFTTAANANCYLAANSPYRGVGSPDIDPGFLAEFPMMTTYAPQDGGWPDTSPTPDYGYHYPTNEDSNFDGIPDWWIWHWFGNYSVCGTNVDANGNTLRYDYQSYTNGNPIDPNVILFSIKATNNYVNTTSPNLQLNIIAGIPSYQTVLVDNTNFDGATWTAYASSNLIVNLGSMEGWHEIWVGLKGPSAEATKSWVWKRIKLDVTPPLLVVTNPVSTNVMQPMIQLQGYSPEALDSISYDLTNALGLVTNQQVLVLDQSYSTNTWEFTTNTFQAFDIPLTNGVNTITLHATDLAGNTTNVTLTFTLDYTGKPVPVVQLYWPQDGTLICNSSYTWRGHVDDPTATVMAQLVDTNGDTNIFNGIVERNGNFWVENLPVSGSTNWLTLTVTDAAGNTTNINIAVFPSAVGLTITMPSSDQLWNQGLTVNGTISDSSDYTVWVNGNKANYTGGTGWQATNVYLPEGGTALIQARAIPNSSNGGNGTGGSGGGLVAYDNPGNPDPTQDNDAESQVDKPMRLYVASYTYSEHAEVHPSGYGYSGGGDQTYSFQQDVSDTWSRSWADGGGGSGSYDANQDTILSGSAGSGSTSTTVNETPQWPGSAWPNLVDGTETFNSTVTDNGETTLNSGSTTVGPPQIGFEHCQENGFAAGSATRFVPLTGSYNQAQDRVVYTRAADTEMKLFTGGKAGSGRQNIFELSASAWRMPWMRLVPNLLGSATYWEWDFPPVWGPWADVDPTEITIGGQAQDANGVAYVAWPDGITKDLPVKTGGDYYQFSPGAGKYTPFITLGGTNIWWFNGESPSGYAMQTTAGVSNAPSGATFAWSISGPAAIVGSSTNSSVTVTNTGPSVSPNDVVVKVTVAGVVTFQTNLTVLAPKSLNLLSNYDQPYGYGYLSQIHYQILDQFNHVLPHSVPWNEDIDANGAASTAAQVTASAISDYAGENWPWGPESGWDGSWTVDPNNAYDNIGRPGGVGWIPNVSAPPPLGSPLGSTKICHSPSGGAFYVGTTGDGGIGVKVKTLTWQIYQDHGRHE